MYTSYYVVDQTHDVLILHATSGNNDGDGDRETAIQFYRYLESLNLGINVVLYENFRPMDGGHFRAMEKVFDYCRYVCIMVTENLAPDASALDSYLADMALTDSITDPTKNNRIVPVWCSNVRPLAFAPLTGLDYFGEIHGKELEYIDEDFKTKTSNWISNGRLQFPIENCR